MKKSVSLVLAIMLALGCVSFAAADEITNYCTYETQAREMETFCYHYSQAAVDLNVLSNCHEHLLTNDADGAGPRCCQGVVHSRRRQDLDLQAERRHHLGRLPG